MIIKFKIDYLTLKSSYLFKNNYDASMSLL